MRHPNVAALAAPVLSAVLALTATTGCSGGDGAAAPSPSASDGVVELAVTVRDGAVRPEPRRVEVEQGSQVRLVVTSDVDDEVHVHGYEAELVLEAGRSATLELVVDQSGVFEVETHEGGLELLQLEVR